MSLSISTSSEFNVSDILHKWSAVHVATVNKIGRTQTVGSIIKRVIKEHSPSQSNTVSVWVSLSQIRLVQTISKKQLMYGQHNLGTIQAIGVDHNDNRLIGYIIKEKNKPAFGNRYNIILLLLLLLLLLFCCSLHHLVLQCS